MELKFADEIQYLGKILNKNGNLIVEITQRKRFGKVRNIMSNKLCINLKMEAINQCVFYWQCYVNLNMDTIKTIIYRIIKMTN